MSTVSKQQGKTRELSDELSTLRREHGEAIQKMDYDLAENIQEKITKLLKEDKRKITREMHEKFREELKDIVAKYNETCESINTQEEQECDGIKAVYADRFTLMKTEHMKQLSSVESEFRRLRGYEGKRNIYDVEIFNQQSKAAAIAGDLKLAREYKSKGEQKAKEIQEERIRKLEKQQEKKINTLIEQQKEEIMTLSQSLKSDLDKNKERYAKLLEEQKTLLQSHFIISIQKISKAATTNGVKGNWRDIANSEAPPFITIPNTKLPKTQTPTKRPTTIRHKRPY